MALLQLPADVDVFGNHVGAPVAHVIQRLATECSHHPRNREHLAIHTLGSLDQADDGRELPHLQAPHQRGAGAHTRVTRHRAHTRKLHQRCHQVRNRIPIEQGIPVDTHQVFTAGRRSTRLQGNGLALVARQVDHPQAFVGGHQLVQDLACVVRGAIVDRDHFNVCVTLPERSLNGFVDVAAFVEARNDHRHQGVAWNVRRRHLVAPGPVAFKVEPEVSPAHDPDPGHEQGVKKYKPHDHRRGKRQEKNQGDTQGQCQCQQGKCALHHGCMNQ